MLIGLGAVVLGTAALAASALTPTLWFVALSCFVTGLGMGLTVTPALIAAQSSVDWDERGVVTGTNLFSRSIGSAVGVAIFGAIANAIFLAAGTETDAGVVASASSAVFIAVVVAAVVTVVAALLMPRKRVDPVSPGPEPAAAS